MLHTSFKVIYLSVPDKIFKGFLPYMGIVAIFVMYLYHLNNILFNHPMEAPHEIWLQLAQWFLSRCLKL